MPESPLYPPSHHLTLVSLNYSIENSLKASGDELHANLRNEQNINI